MTRKFILPAVPTVEQPAPPKPKPKHREPKHREMPPLEKEILRYIGAMPSSVRQANVSRSFGFSIAQHATELHRAGLIFKLQDDRQTYLEISPAGRRWLAENKE